jgi:hypothetical protein
MVSRGFSEFRDKYMSALSSADAPRQGALDGRGNLSTKALIQFCAFFLSTSIDQVEFMTRLLELDSMHSRLTAFAEYWCREIKHSLLKSRSTELGHLFSDLFSRGQLTRGEATAILNSPERTGREIVKLLLSHKLIVSEGPWHPIKLGFPTFITGYYFPKLYPGNVELDFKIPEFSSDEG